MPTNLSVNLNAVAMLRNRRDLPWPSVTGLGALALEAGAHGLTVHPRPDERHIRKTDVFALKEMIARDWPGREFNIEGYPDERFVQLIEEVRPDQVTLVPDDPSQATSDHGWDFAADADFLVPLVAAFKAQGARVSVFVDAVLGAGKSAAGVRADRIEIYTGPYGVLTDRDEIEEALQTMQALCAEARQAGLEVNAGHDLTLENLPALMARAPEISECSIGHGLTADALVFGMKEAVKRYLAALGH